MHDDWNENDPDTVIDSFYFNGGDLPSPWYADDQTLSLCSCAAGEECHV